MIFRSLFAIILLITVLIHTLNAINPAYLRERHHEELVDANSNDIDDENPAIVFKRNNNEDDDYDEEKFLKRNAYPKFHLSPLWLSRRTRTNRIYGKPIWISRTGR
jgi:hypothetical protein